MTTTTSTITEVQPVLRFVQEAVAIPVERPAFATGLLQSGLLSTDRVQIVEETNFGTWGAVLAVVNQVIIPSILEQEGNVENQNTLLSFLVQALRDLKNLSPEARSFLDQWIASVKSGKFNANLPVALSMVVSNVIRPEILKQAGNRPLQVELLGFQTAIGSLTDINQGQAVYDMALAIIDLEDFFQSMGESVLNSEQQGIQSAESRYAQLADRIRQVDADRLQLSTDLRARLQANVDRVNRLDDQRRDQANQVKVLGQKIELKDRKLMAMTKKGLK